MRRARWKRKNVRRVGLRQRRPPAAGGGWLAVPCGSQGRKRAVLGEPFSPGKFGIHPAPLFAAAGRWSMRAPAKSQRNSLCECPGQRVAKRNARKEKLVKCVLATRCRRHPRRGNQLSSLCGTPPRPSYSPRKPAGTLSRRPSHSNFARMCKVATKAVFSFGPCTARFLFHKMEKKMGGCIPAGQAPCGSRHPPGRRSAAPPHLTQPNGKPHPFSQRGTQQPDTPSFFYTIHKFY